MNFLNKYIFGGNDASAKGNDSNLEDSLSKHISEKELEELLVLTMDDLRLFKLVPKGGKLDKQCEFMNASVNLSTKEISIDEQKLVIPFVVVHNEDYDEDQDQMPEEKFPLTQDLIFMKYDYDEDQTDPVRGFVFYYPELDRCYILESQINDQDTLKDVTDFESTICKILFVFTEKRDLRIAQKKHYERYCLETDIDALMSQESIKDIFKEDEESKEFEPVREKQMKQAVKDSREKVLVEKMKNLKVGQEDLKEMKDIEIKIDERLIQVIGHFLKYDQKLERNVLIKEDVFLCIDKTDQSHQYFLHVIDQTGQYSFCRTEILTESTIQLNEFDQLLMWVGKERASGEKPAWGFYIAQSEVMEGLKGVLTKAYFEVNHRAMFDDKSDDVKWMESQIIADRQEDVDMEELENISDYDIPQESVEDYYKQLNMLEESKYEEEESKIDFDLEEEYRDNENRESVQAQSYDRTFVVNGPVVKIYKSAEEETDLQNQRMEYVMHLPVMKNQSGDVINPTNVMLHNSEGQMIFLDDNDKSKMYTYDLEGGKIVDEFQADSNATDMSSITSQFKNSQTSSQQTFYGINNKNIFTLDPRVNKQLKAVVEKSYKTNPQFNCIGTNLDGNFAIGSHDGQIRLYKQNGQNAKTALPGLGDPIREIDVSMDGKWVLATTQTYLLVIPTECESGRIGFDQRMGKEKPMPKKLQIKAQDMAKYKIKSVNFTKARFNNYNVSNMEETGIVTSTGDYLVAWYFKKVKRGQLNCYSIKKLNDRLIDNQFQFNNQEKIVVTEAKSVGIQSRKKKTTIVY